MRTLLLTAVTMAFFAANSLLARFALREGQIDGSAFTAVRILTGAAALALLAALREGGIRSAARHGSFSAAAALFGYAYAFSLAYLFLNAGTGALVLFAAVQFTMFGIGFMRGERPHRLEWMGFALAFSGLIYLLLPGLTAPSPAGVVLMAIAGAAWGIYTLAARGFDEPVAATAGNFLRAAPMAAAALRITWAAGKPHATRLGLALASISGAVTSGLGYAIWYAALRGLRTSQAAIVQLTVPVLAAAAGVILLGERMTWRLALAATAILLGVALARRGHAPAAIRGQPR